MFLSVTFSIFGWFRQTEGDIHNGILRFKENAPDFKYHLWLFAN